MMPSGRREPWKNADGAKERKKEKTAVELWDRQAEGCTDRLRVKIRYSKKTRAPLLVGLPFLLVNVATNWSSGEEHFLWGQRGGLPCGAWCECVCVCTWQKKNPLLQACFLCICGTYLCIPVHVKQHIHTGNVCVRSVGLCVHLRGWVGSGDMAPRCGLWISEFQEWEFLWGFWLSRNSLLSKYRLYKNTAGTKDFCAQNTVYADSWMLWRVIYTSGCCWINCHWWREDGHLCFF